MSPKYKDVFLDTWREDGNYVSITKFRKDKTKQGIALTPEKNKGNFKSKHAAFNVKGMLGLEWCEFLCKHMIG